MVIKMRVMTRVIKCSQYHSLSTSSTVDCFIPKTGILRCEYRNLLIMQLHASAARREEREIPTIRRKSCQPVQSSLCSKVHSTESNPVSLLISDCSDRRTDVNAVMELLQTAVATYASWMSAVDKRVAAWPLMANPWPTLAVCVAYCLAAYILPKKLNGQGRKVFTREKWEQAAIVIFTCPTLGGYIISELEANSPH